MNRQRGFAWFPLLISAAPYLVGAVLVYGAYQWVDNHWVTDAGVAEGRKRAEDELKPPLAACNASLQAQNQAVAALEAAGKARMARAEQGVAAARKAAQSAVSEAQRLREAALAPPVGEGCAAAAAVAEVRRGLGVPAPSSKDGGSR